MSFIALTLMSAAITVVPTGVNEPRQAIVQYGDLNLASANGRNALDQRLDRAVRMVCGRSIGEPLHIKMVVRKCVTRTAKDLEPQRELALSKSGVKFAIGS